MPAACMRSLLKAAFYFGAQFAGQPVGEWERESALRASGNFAVRVFGHHPAHGIEQQFLVLHSLRAGHGKDKFDELVIEEDGAKFEAVGHAHGVAIAQQARLEMRVNIEIGHFFEQVRAFRAIGPFTKVRARFFAARREFSVVARRRDFGIEQSVYVAPQEMDFHGEFGRHEGIVRAGEVGKFSPAKWK